MGTWTPSGVGFSRRFPGVWDLARGCRPRKFLPQHRSPPRHLPVWRAPSTVLMALDSPSASSGLRARGKEPISSSRVPSRAAGSQPPACAGALERPPHQEDSRCGGSQAPAPLAAPQGLPVLPVGTASRGSRSSLFCGLPGPALAWSPSRLPHQLSWAPRPQAEGLGVGGCRGSGHRSNRGHTQGTTPSRNSRWEV